MSASGGSPSDARAESAPEGGVCIRGVRALLAFELAGDGDVFVESAPMSMSLVASEQSEDDEEEFKNTFRTSFRTLYSGTLRVCDRGMVLAVWSCLHNQEFKCPLDKAKTRLDSEKKYGGYRINQKNKSGRVRPATPPD